MRFSVLVFVLVTICSVRFIHENKAAENVIDQQSMDSLWGARVIKLRAENASRGQLFDQGNYAMFIHWGLYSQLGNK